MAELVEVGKQWCKGYTIYYHSLKDTLQQNLPINRTCVPGNSTSAVL